MGDQHGDSRRFSTDELLRDTDPGAENERPAKRKRPCLSGHRDCRYAVVCPVDSRKQCEAVAIAGRGPGTRRGALG